MIYMTFPVTYRPKLSFRKGSGKRYFGAPRRNGLRLHTGCDLVVPDGTPVFAVLDGTVLCDPYHFIKDLDVVAIEILHLPYFTAQYCEIRAA
jgi:hypothetical protein